MVQFYDFETINIKIYTNQHMWDSSFNMKLLC